MCNRYQLANREKQTRTENYTELKSAFNALSQKGFYFSHMAIQIMDKYQKIDDSKQKSTEEIKTLGGRLVSRYLEELSLAGVQSKNNTEHLVELKFEIDTIELLKDVKIYMHTLLELHNWQSIAKRTKKRLQQPIPESLEYAIALSDEERERFYVESFNEWEKLNGCPPDILNAHKKIIANRNKIAVNKQKLAA